MVSYQEPKAGNRAINFAVVSGNKKILDILFNDFKADPLCINNMSLGTVHCAA